MAKWKSLIGMYSTSQWYKNLGSNVCLLSIKDSLKIKARLAQYWLLIQQNCRKLNRHKYWMNRKTRQNALLCWAFSSVCILVVKHDF